MKKEPIYQSVGPDHREFIMIYTLCLLVLS